jgi:ATP-dependent Clp protease ATP-binding subunit ClpC
VFERFTERSRRVVVLAQEEARSLGHPHIGAEHLLLGLLAEGEGRAAQALRALGVSLDATRARLGALVEGTSSPPVGHIPFTDSAKQALIASFDECRGRSEEAITTAHLLLSMFSDPAGRACRLLAEQDVDRAAVERELAGLGPVDEGPTEEGEA